MQNKDIQHIRRALAAWYTQNKRDLPWRRTKNPYPIWVSEVMLQQTQVNTVIPYYQKFIRRWPNIKRLAAADLQQVLKMWEGLGYYSRARNLHRSAQIVQSKFNGKIPDSWEQFRPLPGVGDYIAAAVLSFAFERPHPVLDGNVKRVLARLFEIEAAVNVSSSHKIFYEKAARVFDRQNPATFNQAVMELGAIVCRPANPSCAVCPLQRCCAARHHSAVQDFPRRRRSGSVPEHPIAVGVVFKNRHMLITQRREEGLLGGLWEFPGGKLQKNESPESACIREIKEEVNLDVCIDQHIARVKHAYTHFKIRMDVFCCRYTGGRVKLRGPIAHRWITFDEITGFPLPRANHKFLPQLKAYCEQHPDLFENARRSSHSTAH